MIISVATYALLFMGVPYKWKGNNPVEGFDCSGLACESLKANGLLPHGVDMASPDLLLHFNDGIRTVKVTEQATPIPAGSLLFFGTMRPSHVAIALGNGLMIEAGGGDSTTLTKEDAIKRNAFVRVRPIKYRKDFICALVFKEQQI